MDWISLKDKLPPTDEYVLIADEASVYVGYFVIDAYNDYRCYNELDIIPTHWATLPKPPSSL